MPCYITHTNERVHDLIRANLHRAPMYSGQISSSGPRYCPSIEDKFVKFPDKDRHQVFLEPEGLDTNEVYVNGMSTSMPIDVQAAMACVADDFHALKADGALDRQGFRHWIEELLEGLRGQQIDVSLTEVPQPAACGRLVLCETTLQVDPAARSGVVPSSLAFRLLLAFERDVRGTWRILTSGHLADRE